MTIDSNLVTPQTIPLPDAPSIPNPTPLSIGTHYLFKLKGVVLPAHTHTNRSNHYTVVLKGSFSVTTAARGTWTANAGDVIGFDVGDEHSFVALEDGSEILNGATYGTSLSSISTDVTALSKQVSDTMDVIVAQAQSLNNILSSLPTA